MTVPSGRNSVFKISVRELMLLTCILGLALAFLGQRLRSEVQTADRNSERAEIEGREYRLWVALKQAKDRDYLFKELCQRMLVKDETVSHRDFQLANAVKVDWNAIDESESAIISRRLRP